MSEAWKSKVVKGTAVNWPAGLGGKGNEGVSGTVKQTAGGIGYVELIYAVQNKIPFMDVKNKSGNFVEASVDGVTAAAKGVEIPADFRVSITHAAGDTAFPISSFTWLLVPDEIKDAAKQKAIVAFLKWMLADGQQMTEALSYAPLPAAVVEQEMKAIDKIK